MDNTGIIYSKDQKRLKNATKFTEEKLVVPNGIEIIDEKAFAFNVNIKEVVLPDTIKEIRNDAFTNCFNLERINFPNSLKSIGRQSFYDCASLENIQLNEGLLSISNFAFYGCNKTKEVYIPKTVEFIDDAPFAKCKKLKKIIVDKNNKRYSDCDKNVIFDTKCKELVQGCYTSVIPEDTISINKGSFIYCDKLNKINIPDNVKCIEGFAFYSCHNLEKVTFGKNLLKISCCAFASTSLKNLVLPNSIRYIDESAFANCLPEMESLVLPENIKYVGIDAFLNKKSLKTLTCKCSIENIDRLAFRYCPNIENIYVLDVDEDSPFYEEYKEKIKISK